MRAPAVLLCMCWFICISNYECHCNGQFFPNESLKQIVQNAFHSWGRKWLCIRLCVSVCACILINALNIPDAIRMQLKWAHEQYTDFKLHKLTAPYASMHIFHRLGICSVVNVRMNMYMFILWYGLNLLCLFIYFFLFLNKKSAVVAVAATVMPCCAWCCFCGCHCSGSSRNCLLLNLIMHSLFNIVHIREWEGQRERERAHARVFVCHVQFFSQCIQCIILCICHLHCIFKHYGMLALFGSRLLVGRWWFCMHFAACAYQITNKKYQIDNG